MTELETTIEYYKDLLLYQYINCPKARYTIGLLVSQALADFVMKDVNNAFDLETAVGDQLDILGEYVGFGRNISVNIARTYFSFDDSNSPITASYGFTDYARLTQNVSSTFYSYNGYFDATILDDAEYRTLLKFKIIMNMSVSTYYEIVAFLQGTFGTEVIAVDNLDMTMTYYVAKSLARIISISNQQNLIPKPMGVLIAALYSLTYPSAIFGVSSYQSSTGATIGFSSYSAWLAANIISYTDKA